ncbi:hypothetical protein [Sphingomonas parapaucimobilis]|nr:hypothetical protein [Sphingomonas parapaucimobilis]
MQWLIDTAGKVGPATVALAVLAATIAQNRWNNAVARRSAAVEDQKVRLALLERRLQAIADLDQFRTKLDLRDGIDEDGLQKFNNAMDLAELVFPSAEEHMRNCHSHAFAYEESHLHVVRAAMRGDTERCAQAKQVMDARRRELDVTLSQMREIMITRARMDDVSPLPPPLAVRIGRAVWGRRF